MAIDIPEEWQDAVPRLAGRMGCHVEAVFGRAMALAYAVLTHLDRRGSTVIFRALGLRDAELDLGPLFAQP